MVAPPCFLKNTKISTAHGQIRVNDLEIGDTVVSSGGKLVPIKFVGKRRLNKTTASWIPEIEPVIVKHNAFGDGSPSRDLFVSPEHAFYIDGLMYKAEDLVDGDKIIRMGETPINEIEYFHIDLGFHDLVYAEDAATESFGGVTRKHFDNYAEYCELYGADTKPYKQFAPNAFPNKENAMKIGSFIGGHLPGTFHKFGKPFARRFYAGTLAAEKRLSAVKRKLTN